jgi:uncharacterized membrane-anchored protein
MSYLIIKNEINIQNSETIYLKTAPIDPRSILQGDYVKLNFEVGDAILRKKNYNKYSKAIIKLSPKKIAYFDRFYEKNSKISKNERVINFSKKGSRIVIGTDSYFFQEGKGKEYENKKYGKFKLDKNGNLLLIELIDKVK